MGTSLFAYLDRKAEKSIVENHQSYEFFKNRSNPLKVILFEESYENIVISRCGWYTCHLKTMEVILMRYRNLKI